MDSDETFYNTSTPILNVSQAVAAADANSQKMKLLTLEKNIKKKIIGHDDIISAVCRAVIRSKIFKMSEKPISMMFLGSSGCGKSELAKVLAAELHNDKNKFLRFDMSEFAEAHSLSKFIGAAPGYIGYSEHGGQLTKMVQEYEPVAILFDEIDKASDELVNSIFLQILDEGVLTDSAGNKAFFNDTIIIFSSNVGSGEFSRMDKTIGFAGSSENSDVESRVIKALKKKYKPEFLNRINEIIVFNQLEKCHAIELAKLMLSDVTKVAKKKSIKISFEKSVIAAIVDEGFSLEFGARELRRTIDRQIVDLLANKILLCEIGAGDSICINHTKGKYIIEQKSTKKKTSASKVAQAAIADECELW
jgi:ATP-dependent Clp protease ATP-binding subunit ClpC